MSAIDTDVQAVRAFLQKTAKRQQETQRALISIRKDRDDSQRALSDLTSRLSSLFESSDSKTSASDRRAWTRAADTVQTQFAAAKEENKQLHEQNAKLTEELEEAKEAVQKERQTAKEQEERLQQQLVVVETGLTERRQELEHVTEQLEVANREIATLKEDSENLNQQIAQKQTELEASLVALAAAEVKHREIQVC